MQRWSLRRCTLTVLERKNKNKRLSTCLVLVSLLRSRVVHVPQFRLKSNVTQQSYLDWKFADKDRQASFSTSYLLVGNSY